MDCLRHLFVAMSSRVAYSGLEFRSEVWSGDINGKVTGT